MPLDTATDIDDALEEAGVAVTIGDVSGFGILDQSTVIEDSDGGQYQKRVTTLLVRTGVFTLSDSAAVTADSNSYVIRQWDLEDDGKLTRIILARAT